MAVSDLETALAVADSTPDDALVTGALLKAADLVGLRAKELAPIIGVSESGLSRMRSGNAVLQPGTKGFELALLVLRVLRSAAALFHSDFIYVGAWLRAEHDDLTPTPLACMRSVTGLIEVADHLDYYRGRA